MTGTYDALIQIPVDGQPASVDQYGVPVRNAILDLDARVIAVAGLGIPVAPVSTSSNGTTTSGTTDTLDSVLGTYTFTAIAGVRYRAMYVGGEMNTSVAGDKYNQNIRNGGASTPTSASPSIAASSRYVAATLSAGRTGLHVMGTFVPGAGLVTLGLFTARSAGTGVGTPTATSLRELFVEAIGYV
jgi:hypothetical protein